METRKYQCGCTYEEKDICIWRLCNDHKELINKMTGNGTAYINEINDKIGIIWDKE